MSTVIEISNSQLESKKEAFVFVGAKLGTKEELIQQLRPLEHIAEIYGVQGLYDVVVKVEAESKERLQDTILSKIKQNENVTQTLTIVVR